MKSLMLLYLFFFIMFAPLGLLAISVVYNFRIAQITKQSIHEPGHDYNNMVVALLFDEYLRKYDDDHQNYFGGFISYIYNWNHFYFRTDFAVSHMRAFADGVKIFSGTTTDDILFTAGRSFIVDPRTRVTVSGLFGLPTHRIHALEHPDFGYGQIGMGAQMDGAYELARFDGDLLFGVRYIHFFSAKAFDDGIPYIFSIGNVADLLLAYKKNWHSCHGYEFGYTARFDFGASIYPDLADVVTKTNYTRSSFYFVYKYRFTRNDTLNRLLWYISYGFDHKPKIYGSRYIITLWTSWSISF